MSSERRILEYLYQNRVSSYDGGMKFRFGILGIFNSLNDFKYQTLANRCHDLKKKGLIKKGKEGEYFITNKGVDFFESGKSILKDMLLKPNTNSSKNLIVMYDIPQDQKKEREWFRRHLKKLNFEMIQKSVWVGPSPIPKDFLEYVEEIGIKDNFKTFKLSRGYKSK